eukprot:5016620-Pyramimonas_sp.AAC.1
MHIPRYNRIDAVAISEQFTGWVVHLQYERTQNDAADIGAKRLTDPPAWVKVLHLVNIVTPKFWKGNRYRDYLASMFTGDLPLNPGGFSSRG